MNPYLSIIVPVYNVELYLHQCVDSILNQSFDDFELILVDDGSPDKCPHICDEYAKKDKRVIVIHKNNGGLVSARKTGLKVAKGEYIGYVDSDDWIEKEMYEQLCKITKLHKTDIAICDVILSYENEEIKTKQIIKPGFYNKEDMRKSVYPIMLYSGSFYNFGLLPAVWNKIFRRELLEKSQYQVDNVIRMGEDAACTYPCMLDANSIYMLDDKYFYHYRQIESSMTKKYDDQFLNRILVLYKQLKVINKDKDIFDLSKQLYYYLTYLVLLALINENSKQNKKSNNEKIKFIDDLILNRDIMEALRNISLKGVSLKTKICIFLLQRKQSIILHQLILIACRTQRIRHFIILHH